MLTCWGARGTRCCCWAAPPCCPQPPRAVSLRGAPPGAPPLPWPGPAHVIPGIRQSQAEPLVIPCRVGTGLCPFLSAAQLGDTGGTLHRDTRGGTALEQLERDRDTLGGHSPGAFGWGHPDRDTPATPSPGWGHTVRDHAETLQGHPHLDKDHAGTSRDTWGGTVGTRAGTARTRGDVLVRPQGQGHPHRDTPRAALARGHPGPG